MNIIKPLAFVLGGTVLAACGLHYGANSIVGTWKTTATTLPKPGVNAIPFIVSLNFQNNGRVALTFVPGMNLNPFAAYSMNAPPEPATKGETDTYTIKGEHLTLFENGQGEPMDYSIDGDTLTLTLDSGMGKEVYSFKRVQ